MKKSIERILKKKKKSKDYTLIKKKFTSKGSSKIEQGVVHGFSKELVQLASIEDFKYTQTIVFPFNHINKFRFNKVDKYYNQLLHQEKVQNRIKKLSQIDLTNWKSVFRSLKSACIIIETEKSKNRVFHIGAIVKTRKKGVDFIHFDALGKFEKTIYFIKYSEITKLVLDSNYAKVFKKYVRK